MTTKRRVTFEQACRQYVHRFTMEHVPQWARQPLSPGKHYAPQYRSDREWYEHTKFPGEKGWIGQGTDAYTSGQTFPCGLFLAEPYTQGDPNPRPWTAEAPPQLWASYTSTAKYGVNGISLHASELDACRSVAEYIGLREFGIGSTEELYAWIEEHADEDGTDWYIGKVDLP